MPTPPRFQVLNEAQRVIEDCLRGRTDDEELRYLAKCLWAREREQELVAKMRESYEKLKMSPFAKMMVFYVALFALSIVASAIDRKVNGGSRRNAPRSPFRGRS